MISIRQTFTGLIIVNVLAFVSWFSISAGVPKIWAPINILVFLPLLMLDEFFIDTVGGGEVAAIYLAVALNPVVFWIWCLPVLRGSSHLPLRSLIVFGCAVVLSFAWLMFGWEYAVEYQGLRHAQSISIISACWWLGIGVLAWLARRRPSHRRNLAFHAALFAWLAWYGIPYMGELP